MKKVFIFFLVAICLMGFIGCADKDPPLEIPEGAVIIDGAEIYRKYAVLPLCDVIEALGFELTRNGDSASFFCNDIEYVISITEKTLTKVGVQRIISSAHPAIHIMFAKRQTAI